MFKITKTSVRPSTDVPFIFEVKTVSEDIAEHVQTVFKDTGKLISTSRFINDDELTVTHVSVFDSHESFMEFVSDSVVFENIILPQQLHDISNDIISQTESEEV